MWNDVLLYCVLHSPTLSYEIYYSPQLRLPRQQKKTHSPKGCGPSSNIMYNYIFLPTLVFLATGAALAFAAALGALGAFAFFSATTVASSTASVDFLRERRVLGLASSAAAAGSLPNV